MKKKKRRINKAVKNTSKKIGKKVKPAKKSQNNLSIYTQVNQLKKQLDKLTGHARNVQERLEDSEIHINLLTRLVTTLCVEKMGMRVGVLKRLLKRIEKEAIRDSQILHLESLYNLPQEDQKKPPHPKKPKKHDPWEDIS